MTGEKPTRRTILRIAGTATTFGSIATTTAVAESESLEKGSDIVLKNQSGTHTVVSIKGIQDGDVRFLDQEIDLPADDPPDGKSLNIISFGQVNLGGEVEFAISTQSTSAVERVRMGVPEGGFPAYQHLTVRVLPNSDIRAYGVEE